MFRPIRCKRLLLFACHLIIKTLHHVVLMVERDSSTDEKECIDIEAMKGLPLANFLRKNWP